jgi:hypothetical protein
MNPVNRLTGYQQTEIFLRLLRMSERVETLEDFYEFLSELMVAFEKGAFLEHDMDTNRSVDDYLSGMQGFLFTLKGKAERDETSSRPSWSSFAEILLRGFVET